MKTKEEILKDIKGLNNEEVIKSREEKRKVYDHYESKLSKINKNNI